MSFFSYLDEEYFHLQDFLSTLVDTMPMLDPHSVPNDKTFVQTLIDQNKIYAKKVVSLYQKFNSIYSNTSHSLEKSERASANAFVDRLKEKLNDYEDEIQRIKAENESYVKQLKLVYQQNDLLQAKDSLFTQEGANPQLTSREVSPNVKKSMNNSFNIPSPIPRTSNLSRVSKDALIDLEHMFQSAEYRRAMEILSQLDYEVPQEIPLEKINKWLTISNRIKDSQFLEIFQRLKSLTSIEAENIGPKGERNSLAKGFEEVLDQQKLNVVDKIYWVLDEKMANMTSRKDTTKKNYETEESGYQTAYFKETRGEDFGLNDNQLRQKISYLKESLNASEMILRDREAEIRMLKDKLRNSDEGDRKSESISDISGGKGRVRANGEAKEVKNERDLYRRKYEESIKELDEYKERYNNVQEEADEYRTRYESFERKIKLISENAEKLREENDLLRRQAGTGSGQELLDEREESVENYYRAKPTSLAKDLDAPDFTGDNKAHQRTPTVDQIVPAESVHLKSLGLKGNLLLGNALQVQKNNIYNTKQALTEFKVYISEKLRSLEIESQALLSPKLEPDSAEHGDVPSEIQRAIKANTNMIKGIASEIKDLKRDTINIINKLSWSQPIQSPKRKNTETDANLRERIGVAEEKLMDNLSQTLQSLSKLTASLHEMGDSGLEGALAEGMAEVFEDLQTVHSRIEKTIQEFPEFSGHEIKIEGKTMPRRGPVTDFQYDTTTNSLRKKLANDRNDLTSQLRMTLQKFDSTVANDALERLSEEISKNQDLQDIIEAKNLLIHRLNLLYSEGMENCEISVRHLFQLADSEDAQRIVEAILDNMRAFRRTFAEANAQYRSPTKRIRVEEDELRQDSTQGKLTKSRSRSALKSNLKESRVSPERSPGMMSKKGSVYSIKWGDKEERGIPEDAAGWVITEKQKILDEMNTRCEELRQKVKAFERDNFELSKQVEMLKDSSEKMQRRNEELKMTLEQKEDECRIVEREASRDHETKRREIEELRRRIEHIDRENQELKSYKATTESVLKRASDQVGHLKLGYFSEVNMLKEENERLEKQRQEIVYELERKVEENAKLNQLIDTLQKFSNKQLESLREKEEKVLVLANQKRESEVMVRELERQLEALAGKNKMSLERAKESMDDVSNAKYELSKAIERCDLSQRELETLTLRNRELAQDRDNLLRRKEALEAEKSLVEDKMKKMSEIVEITRGELKKSHELVELRSEEIKRKDKEIQKLREAGLQKEDLKEPDYVTYLKRELQARSDELQRVKGDYRRTLDTNEKLSSEIDNLKATSRLGVPSNRPSVIGGGNVSQHTIRKDFNRSGEDLRGEERDVRSGLGLRKNDSSVLLNEQRSRVFEGSYTERPERGASGQKLFTLGDSGAKIQHTIGLAQQKDKEIQRLNQVVKDLTNSLQSSQNSNNSQIRRQIQFSSPQ